MDGEGKSRCVERSGKSEPARRRVRSFFGNVRGFGVGTDESCVGRARSSTTSCLSDSLMAPMVLYEERGELVASLGFGLYIMHTRHLLASMSTAVDSASASSER